MSSVTVLAGTELRLMTREWAAMVFAFAFPVLLMLILPSLFGNEASPEYGGVTPAAYYVADYVVVPLGALALIGLPVMIASYRERGILRRFEAAGVSVTAVVSAQALVSCALVLLGATAVLLVAAPTYGIPAVENVFGVLIGFVLAISTMTSVGVMMGLLARTARSAQALGLLAFFPMWLLGASGPPRPVMPEVMARISDLLPLGHAGAVIREPWLDTGSTDLNLLALGLWLVLSSTMVTALLRRQHSR